MDIKPIVKKFNTDNGIILFSIILGWGIAALFKKQCIDGKCYIVHAKSNPDDIAKYYWKLNDDCYKYTPKEVDCNIK